MCDDDSGEGLNPFLTITGASGVFDIWIGTITEGNYPEAQLFISELADNSLSFEEQERLDNEYLAENGLLFSDDYFDGMDLFSNDSSNSSSSASSIANQEAERARLNAQREEYRRILGNFDFPGSCGSPPRMLSDGASNYAIDAFNDDMDYWYDCNFDGLENDLAAIKDLIIDLGGSSEWSIYNNESWSWNVPSECDCRDVVNNLHDFAFEREGQRRDTIDQINNAIDNYNSRSDAQDFWSDLGDSLENSFIEMDRQQQDLWDTIYNMPYVTPGYL